MVDFSIYGHRTERDVVDILRMTFEGAGPIRDFTMYAGKRNVEGTFWSGRHSRYGHSAEAGLSCACEGVRV